MMNSSHNSDSEPFHVLEVIKADFLLSYCIFDQRHTGELWREPVKRAQVHPAVRVEQHPPAGPGKGGFGRSANTK